MTCICTFVSKNTQMYKAVAYRPVPSKSQLATDTARTIQRVKCNCRAIYFYTLAHVLKCRAKWSAVKTKISVNRLSFHSPPYSLLRIYSRLFSANVSQFEFAYQRSEIQSKFAFRNDDATLTMSSFGVVRSRDNGSRTRPSIRTLRPPLRVHTMHRVYVRAASE